ncbi:hypothetical protein QE152_g8140 [Popillia japonica]|uniref:Uncharacterized protein n=1 Tax=Popillia japonica TaxID=7064 RepID=A0AAW1MBY8_POPJA
MHDVSVENIVLYRWLKQQPKYPTSKMVVEAATFYKFCQSSLSMQIAGNSEITARQLLNFDQKLGKWEILITTIV